MKRRNLSPVSTTNQGDLFFSETPALASSAIMPGNNRQQNTTNNSQYYNSSPIPQNHSYHNTSSMHHQQSRTMNKNRRIDLSVSDMNNDNIKKDNNSSQHHHSSKIIIQPKLFPSAGPVIGKGSRGDIDMISNSSSSGNNMEDDMSVHNNMMRRAPGFIDNSEIFVNNNRTHYTPNNIIREETIKQNPNSFIDYETISADERIRMRMDFMKKLARVIEINPSVKNVVNISDPNLNIRYLGDLVDIYYVDTVGSYEKNITRKKNKNATLEKFRIALFLLFGACELGVSYLSKGKINMTGFCKEELEKMKKYNNLFSELYDEWYGKEGSGEPFKLSVEMKLFLLILLNMSLGMGGKVAEKFIGKVHPFIMDAVYNFVEPSILGNQDEPHEEGCGEDGYVTKTLGALTGMFGNAMKNNNSDNGTSPVSSYRHNNTRESGNSYPLKNTPDRMRTPKFKRKNASPTSEVALKEENLNNN